MRYRTLEPTKRWAPPGPTVSLCASGERERAARAPDIVAPAFYPSTLTRRARVDRALCVDVKTAPAVLVRPPLNGRLTPRVCA